MVTKKIALAAMNEDATQTVQEDIFSPININPEPIQVAQQQYVVFRLVNKKVKRLTLDGICNDVKNPNTG